MFPILLGTLFYVAFGSIFESYASGSIKTSVRYETEDDDLKDYINDFLTSLSMGDGKLLEIVDVSEEEAEKMLEDDKINGIITVTADGRLKLKIHENGNQSSIQENIVTAYNQSADLVEKVAAEHPEKLQEVLEEISDRVTFINAKNMAGENKDPYVQYFYNLIAMTTLFAALNSLRVGTNCQANMSAIGARTNASPLRRTTAPNTSPSHAPAQGPKSAAPITIGARVRVMLNSPSLIEAAKIWSTTTIAVIRPMPTIVIVYFLLLSLSAVGAAKVSPTFTFVFSISFSFLAPLSGEPTDINVLSPAVCGK